MHPFHKMLFTEGCSSDLTFTVENNINEMLTNATFKTVFVDPSECKELWVLDIPGISAENVTVEKMWKNRTKELNLFVTITCGGIKHTKVKLVDTSVFDKYSYEVKDGRLTITLYEIINEEPKFELI